MYENEDRLLHATILPLTRRGTWGLGREQKTACRPGAPATQSLSPRGLSTRRGHGTATCSSRRTAWGRGTASPATSARETEAPTCDLRSLRSGREWQATASERGHRARRRREMTYRQAYFQRQALELYTQVMRVPPALVVTAP